MLLEEDDLLEDDARARLGEADEELGERPRALGVLRVELAVGDLAAGDGKASVEILHFEQSPSPRQSDSGPQSDKESG